ncbi:MAG TPA: OsmC family protein [Gaiellaceae bacterium]|nr:OsmC family protein [Gaiellaceae bacterium]
MPPRAKRFDYDVQLDRAGRVAAGEGAALELPEEWTPEHLVLAGLVRCSITSLRYHAARAGADAVAGGSARGVVTKREEDGRYAFVEIECRIDVEVEPAPEDVPGLLAKAERDCFVAASLTVKPSYRWTVNGEEA